MSTTLRQIKGSGLTNAEIDANFAEKVTQAGHGLAIGDLVKVRAAGGYEKSQADSEANLSRGVVVAVSGDDVYVRHAPGPITKAAHGYGSRGDELWEDQSTAGIFTASEPVSGIVRSLGFVLDADTVLYSPQAWTIV